MSSKSYDRPLEHKEYIKLKYLSQGSDNDLKKKTKKKKLVSNRTKKIKIFDDDIDFKKITANDSDDELHFATKEEKPVIAGVVDERPLHMRRKDIDRNQWRTVSHPEEEDEINDEKKPGIIIEIKSEKKQKKRNQSESSDISVARSRSRKISSSRGGDNRSDSDLSPPRSEAPNSGAKRRRHDSDSDLSPPRGQQIEAPKKQRHDSDSDLSPPRAQSERKGDKKREKTLAGKKAGLSEAKHLREELLETKRKEQILFDSASDDIMGKNAKTVFRDKKSGRIRNLEEEARAQREKDLVKDKIEAEKKAKYDKWSRGLVQTQEKQDKRESDLHEMSKPLARYEDDKDLDEILRNKERDDDPMLAAIRENKTKKKMEEEGIKVRPEYKGPPPPMNRFGIRPGYRWDGVDRSNGYEKKWYERISNKEAIQEEAYRWSTQDM